MVVQYWRSMDHLQRYARSPHRAHSAAWKKLFVKGTETAEYGFLHEAFEVKAGSYECIYVNMPPVLLANTIGALLVDASGAKRSASGRTGRADAEDWPAEMYARYAEL